MTGKELRNVRAAKSEQYMLAATTKALRMESLDAAVRKFHQVPQEKDIQGTCVHDRLTTRLAGFSEDDNQVHKWQSWIVVRILGSSVKSKKC